MNGGSQPQFRIPQRRPDLVRRGTQQWVACKQAAAQPAQARMELAQERLAPDGRPRIRCPSEALPNQRPFRRRHAAAQSQKKARSDAFVAENKQGRVPARRRSTAQLRRAALHLVSTAGH
jgi:hypothetical protein